jgi:hypothetical protein
MLYRHLRANTAVAIAAAFIAIPKPVPCRCALPPDVGEGVL